MCAVLLTCLPALGCGRSSDLPRIAEVPAFSLRDQDGRVTGPEAFRGKVWIANFIFTNCPDVCPILTGKLSGLRTDLLAKRSELRFVSFSVDPIRDTPEALKKYAVAHNADQPDWRFLTGPVDELKRVVVQGFKQTIDPRAGESGETPTILHGTHFVLIDRQLTIRGYYRSDQEGLVKLARDARILTVEKPMSKAKP